LEETAESPVDSSAAGVQAVSVMIARAITRSFRGTIMG
jgi:hypothetical protein